MTGTFQLHPRLASDCMVLGRFELCLLLLMNERRYPWFILVPQRPGIGEIHHLAPPDLDLLQGESVHLSRQLSRCFEAHKMNIAALGNVVPQLHVHHIVRYRHDPAWPDPVWGRLPPEPYPAEETAVLRQRLLPALLEREPAFEVTGA